MIFRSIRNRWSKLIHGSRQTELVGNVFVHVPRTAGSSIWHNLVQMAAVQGASVFDIYHESKLRHGIPEAGARVLTELQCENRNSRMWFHHHTSENIFRHFNVNESVFATVLRDPVERFVSDVCHYRSFFHSCEPGSPVATHTARFWSPPFTESLQRKEIELRELLEMAMAEPFFCNYYVNFFSTLLWSEPETGSVWEVADRFKSSNLVQLAQDMRRHFQIIGDFAELQAAFSIIQEAFTGASSIQPLTLKLNQARLKPALTCSDRLRYATAFEADYILLDELSNRSEMRFSTESLSWQIQNKIHSKVA